MNNGKKWRNFTIKQLQCHSIHHKIVLNHFSPILILQEYGITEPEKVEIGRMILSPLVRKLMADLKVASTDDVSDNPYRLNPS